MRIVVKVGTSTLAHSTGRMNIRRVEALCKVLSDVKNAGHVWASRSRRTILRWETAVSPAAERMKQTVSRIRNRMRTTTTNVNED